MKILFTMFGWDEPGGGTMLPKQEAIELQNRGNEVIVFYAGLDGGYFKEPYYLGYSEDISGVKLYGIFNRPIPFINTINPELEIKDEKVCDYFIKILDEIQPDIIHFQNFIGLSFEIAKIARAKGYPSVFTLHNYHLIDQFLYMFKDILSNPKRDVVARSIINELTDLTLAVSNRQKEIFVDFGCNPNKIQILPQTTPMIDKLNIPRMRVIHNPVRFGYIGSFLLHKGIEIMINTALKYRDAKFVIYGLIPHRIYQKLRIDGLDKIIDFKGGYRQKEMFGIPNEIDMMILPSIWEECQGLTLLESFAMGIPVIAHNIGGFPDFIKEGINGHLYNSTLELYDLIEYYINNPSKILELKTEIPFTFDEFIRQLENIYDRLSLKNLNNTIRNCFFE